MGLIEGPAKTIKIVVQQLATSSDDQVLSALAAIKPLPDESDLQWDDEPFWYMIAYRFLGVAAAARERKLRSAVRLILERAAYGDPGERMHGLRHVFDDIFAPEWPLLADEYLALARAERLGTRMWAIASLMVLDDPRAVSVFTTSLREDPEDISHFARIGLERLRRKGTATN